MHLLRPVVTDGGCTVMHIDIESVLDALEIDYSVRGNEANALCPMHKSRTGKDDNSPSWWLNLESGQHICFSCHYKGNLLHLIADVKQFYLPSWGDIVDHDIAAAHGWLATITEVSPERLAAEFKKIPSRVEQYTPLPDMSEARLAVFGPPPTDKLEERKLSWESAAAYEIMWDASREAWVLPFRDPTNGKLLGWQEKGTKDRTFLNRPPGLPRSKTLFGFPQLREDVVYLVESPLDAARLYSAGFPGAVAICGSTMNEEQVKLVRGAERIVAAFDNPKIDKAGKGASDQLRSFALKYGLNLSYFNYGDTGKKDPGDMTDEEIAWGIANAQSFLKGEFAYV